MDIQKWNEDFDRLISEIKQMGSFLFSDMHGRKNRFPSGRIRRKMLCIGFIRLRRSDEKGYDFKGGICYGMRNTQKWLRGGFDGIAVHMHRASNNFIAFRIFECLPTNSHFKTQSQTTSKEPLESQPLPPPNQWGPLIVL